MSRIKSTSENWKSGKLKFPKKLTHISTNASFWARWSGELAREARCLYCLTRSNHRHRRPEAEAPVPVGCSCSGVSRVTSPERDLFVVLYDSSSKHHSYNPTSASTGTPLLRTCDSLRNRHGWSLRKGCPPFRLASGQEKLRIVNATFSTVKLTDVTSL